MKTLVPNRRRHPRYKVLKEAKVFCSNEQSLVDVIITDLSVGGARIQLKSSTDLAGAFKLWVTTEKMLYPVETRWQKEKMVGFNFNGEPVYVSIHKIN